MSVKEQMFATWKYSKTQEVDSFWWFFFNDLVLVSHLIKGCQKLTSSYSLELPLLVA